MSLFCSYRCSLLFITERDWFVLTKVMEFVCDSDETNENEADYWSETVVLTPLSSNGFQSEIDHRFPPVGTIVNNEPQGSFYNLLNNDESYAVPDPEQLYQDSFIVIPEQHGHLFGNPVNLGYDALPQYSQYPPQQEQIQVKRSTTTSRKTRKSKEKRTASINYAYQSLRQKIPNVPVDTKLSKIKTLRFATNYIKYLGALLNNEIPNDTDFNPINSI